MISYLCYVTFDDVPAYEAKGWIVVSGLYGNHGHYAVLMEATKEAWLPVEGFEGLYEVSNTGHVRSLPRLVNSRGGKRVVPGRVMRPGSTKTGYRQVQLAPGSGGAKQPRYVASLVAAAWLGRRPDGFDVCHNDGNKANNDASNLRYDTRAGNMADTALHGTRVKGAAVHASKLTEAEVREVRKLAVFMERNELAQRFGVTTSAIDHIIKRQVWSHLQVVDGEVGTPSADAERKERIRSHRSARMAALHREGEPT